MNDFMTLQPLLLSLDAYNPGINPPKEEADQGQAQIEFDGGAVFCLHRKQVGDFNLSQSQRDEVKDLIEALKLFLLGFGRLTIDICVPCQTKSNND